MDDMQPAARVADDAATEQLERSRSTTAAPAARMLANPRRVRRA